MEDLSLESDFEKYPDLLSFKLKLAELKCKDFSSYSEQELRNELHESLEMVATLIANFSKENFNNYIFYRVRLNVNTDAENMSMIRTYSYPPPQYCTCNGRANLKNKTVFYCSNSPLTAIMETKPMVGDIGYLSVWQGNTDREMKGGIFLPDDLKSENDWTDLANDIHLFYRKSAAEIPKGKGEFYQELVKFSAHLFLNEKPPYWLTSWIANESLFGEKWKDFIVYPSYINKAYSCNLAFHPNTVDRFLKFKKVIRFKIISRVGDIYEISSGRVGEVINTDMEFRYALPGELSFLGKSTAANTGG